MKLKIFKHALLTAITALAISTSVSAQDSLAVPPMPPVKLKLNKAYKQNMADLKVKMKQLQKRMDQKNFKMKMDMDMKFAFKDFDKNFNMTFKDFDKNLSEGFKDLDKNFKDLGKNFNDSFKDFGKNFSGSFSEMSPDLSGLKSLDRLNYSINNNADNEEYKQKVASGEMTEKVKSYSKSYSVDANDVLQISNSFGKVVVNTWAKKEFKVDVQMKFSADDEDYVNNMINGSSISDSKDGSIVSFKTILARNNSNHGHNNIKVNYTVYMPAGNAVEINNRFGNVNLPDLSGKVIANINFGNLIAQQLTNNENEIIIKNTQEGTSTIATFNGGKLKVSFGKLNVGTLSNANADIAFSSMNVGRLKNSVIATVKYGDGINIGIIDKSVKNVNINASSTKINLDFKESDSFNFYVISKLGDFNYSEGRIKMTAKTPTDEERGWSSTKTYKGYIGKNDSDGKININARFTEVRFL